MFWLMRHTNKLPPINKRKLYIQVIRPIWTYGIQLWGTTAAFNYSLIQTSQNKVLRKIIGATWYVSNTAWHHDLLMETVEEVHVDSVALTRLGSTIILTLKHSNSWKHRKPVAFGVDSYYSYNKLYSTLICDLTLLC